MRNTRRVRLPEAVTRPTAMTGVRIGRHVNARLYWLPPSAGDDARRQVWTVADRGNRTCVIVARNPETGHCACLQFDAEDMFRLVADLSALLGVEIVSS